MQKVIKKQKSPLFIMVFPGMGKTYFTSKASQIEGIKVYDFDYGYVRKGYDIMSDSTDKEDIKKYNVYLYNSYSDFTRLIDFDLAFGNEPDTAKFIRKGAKVMGVLPSKDVDPVLYTDNLRSRASDGSNDEFADLMLKNGTSGVAGGEKQAGTDFVMYGGINDPNGKHEVAGYLTTQSGEVKSKNIIRGANSVFGNISDDGAK